MNLVLDKKDIYSVASGRYSREHIKLLMLILIAGFIVLLLAMFILKTHILVLDIVSIIVLITSFGLPTVIFTKGINKASKKLYEELRYGVNDVEVL